MINNLPESLQSSSVLFAYDPCFCKVGNNIEELNKRAQNFLNKFEVWCTGNKNGKTISNTKSTAILFTKKRKNKEITLTFFTLAFNSLSIETSTQIKYLGVIL